MPEDRMGRLAGFGLVISLVMTVIVTEAAPHEQTEGPALEETEDQNYGTRESGPWSYDVNYYDDSGQDSNQQWEYEGDDTYYNPDFATTTASFYTTTLKSPTNVNGHIPTTPDAYGAGMRGNVLNGKNVFSTQDYNSGKTDDEFGANVYDDTHAETPEDIFDHYATHSDGFDTHANLYNKQGGEFGEDARGDQSDVLGFINNKNESAPIREKTLDEKEMDPIVILSIVIGVSLFFIIIAGVGLLILVRSRCTLSPPEPTLLTYHPHVNTMETSFTHNDAEDDLSRDVTDNGSVTASSAADTMPRDSEKPHVANGEQATADKGDTNELPSTQLQVVVVPESIIRPRPRPSFSSKQKLEEAHPLKSKKIKRHNGTLPSKPVRHKPGEKNERSNDIIEISAPVVMRKKAKQLCGAIPYQDGQVTNPLQDSASPNDRGRAMTSTTSDHQDHEANNYSPDAKSNGIPTQPSDSVSSGTNPIDTMHRVLLSMDAADDTSQTPVQDPPLDTVSRSQDNLNTSENEFNECVNPLYLSTQTIDSRVASFLMRPNPAIPCETADIANNIDYCDDFYNELGEPHICQPGECHYPVFFTQSCPNTPLFKKKIEDDSDTFENEPNLEETKNNENTHMQSAWKSETNLALFNKLNGFNVYLRPAMCGDQLLNSHVCPATWLFCDQFMDDRWEMRTTF